MSKSNPYEHDRYRAEEVHVLFYRLHWQLVDASDTVRAALLKLHEREVGSYRDDGREVLREWVARLETTRDALSELLFEAGNQRTEIIRATGCDGECSDKAANRDQTAPVGKLVDQSDA